MTKFILEIGLLSVIVFVSFYAGKKHGIGIEKEKTVEVVEKYNQLVIDSQYRETEIYSDCQRMMEVNMKTERVNGCYVGIERICNQKTKQPEFCIKKLLPACGSMGDERE